MGYDGIKLVYCDKAPQWLLPDGSLKPAVCQRDGTVAPTSFYMKDRVSDASLRAWVSA
ncbi:hypothetical protein AGMMS49957_13360 [Synergistales bacterium]|nr:hypothetical protein AGMMS49957_13360 [Synergistales bacterium]